MACSLCGEICRCAPSTERTAIRRRFQPELGEGGGAPVSSVPIDPEADEGREQRIAASLDAAARPRFVVEVESKQSLPVTPASEEPSQSLTSDPLTQVRILLAEIEETLATGAIAQSEVPGQAAIAAPAPADPMTSQNAGSWREEVAARVNSFRSRRRVREPRYPSLPLKVEPTLPPSDASRTRGNETTVSWTLSGQVTRQSVALDHLQAATPDEVDPAVVAPEPDLAKPAPAETGGKIIQFPRSNADPPVPLDELAEPVCYKPRILEAPEVAPPPPAMGGILIDTVKEPENDKRPGIDVPLQSAPLGRRMLAGGVDGVLVLGAFALFAYVFFKMTAQVPPRLQMVEATLVFSGLFWAGYQYLLLVHTGTTPGLWIARLRLSRFDGSPVSRGLRRWRVLASWMSGFSLGLGYAWGFLDEDALCWHDRITRTYLAPKK
jgi:uncharacterized RDD family membrane protein YckC